MENLKGKVLVRLDFDGVDGSESVSGNNDSVVSEEISIGSFTIFGSP